jgi:hypothetical protein
MRQEFAKAFPGATKEELDDAINSYGRNSGSTNEFETDTPFSVGVPLGTGGVTQSGTIQDVSYANKSVAVNGGREPWVGNNGTKMYTIQDNPDNIYEYTLSTAWDVTTATYIGTSALSGTISPAGLIFKPDGTKFFIGDFSTNKVHQYNLSTAWDVSTISTGTAVSANDPYGLAFSSDGTQFYTCTAGSGGQANQYSLSTAWDLSSTVTSVSSLSVISGARAITFYDDGTRFFVLNGYAGTPYLAEYTCTAWTLSTAVATGNTFTFSETTSAVGAFVADNNTRLYLNNEGGTKKIWQYDIAQVATSDYTRLTNAQVGSRFEETDTRKMYHYNEQSQDFASVLSTYAPNFFLKLDEGTGTALTNSGSTTAYTASITQSAGTPVWDTGIAGSNKAVKFTANTSSAFIGHSNLPTESTGDNFTLGFTFKVPTNFTGGDYNNHHMWQWDNNALGFWQMNMSNAGYISAGWYNAGWQHAYGTTDMMDNAWHTFFITCTSSSALIGYLDGVQEFSATANRSGYAGNDVNWLGHRSGNGTISYDNAFFKNSVLTASEMSSLHDLLVPATGNAWTEEGT